MQTNSCKNKAEFKLGEIMVVFGILSSGELERGLKLSSITGLPLGKTLIFLEYIQEQLLRDLIEAQSMLRDKLVSVEEVKSALNLVKISSLHFGEALIHLGIKPVGSSSRLGELLSEAKKLDSNQLKFGLQISDHSGLPLGRVLVMLNVISDDCLRVTLALQRQLRTGDIVMHTATNKIKSIRQADVTAAKLPCIPVSGIACDSQSESLLGILLTKAKIIKEGQFDEIASRASDCGKMIGQSLAESGILSAEVLSLALRLQILVTNGNIDIPDAVEILKEVQRAATTIGACEENSSSFNFYDFLRMGNYLTLKKQHELARKLFDNPSLLCTTFKVLKLPVGNNLHPSLIIEQLYQNDCLLRSILMETIAQDRSYVESAFVFYTLVKNQKMGLCEAIMNFIIKNKNFQTQEMMIA